LTAPAFLKTDEKTLFIELAALNAHLTASDTPMLAAYVQAITKTHRLAWQKDVAAWERCARVAMAMARSLRLTAISGTHPERLSRQRRDARPNPVDEYLATIEDEDDDA
jgi:hypothetical protein